MFSIIASPVGFTILISLFAIGAIGSLCAGKDDKLANGWSGLFAILGSLWGILFSGTLLLTGQGVAFHVVQQSFPLLALTFSIDQLAAFFLFTISLIALFCSIYGTGYLKHFYQKYNIGSFGFFYHLFILGMLLVVTVSNGLFFLVVWEIMSIASYVLVVFDRHDKNNVKAGFVYLVMTHIGTAFIITALLLLYRSTGSFDFAAIRSAAELIPLSVKNAVFVLAMIGFGTKAGIIPFHIWLPSAHPAAPSHVSGLMSGVMIKTGVFMMIRLFLDLLQPVPMWWGLAVLVIGSISAVLGVLYALTEHDIKRLLAYHSIENIGIILLGVGSALTFSSLGLMSLALLGLSAALFHVLNHATFKSLLFLSAGSVIHQTHTRNMEEYGGLIKRMPQTAAFFLIGSMAISALPPFNGFFSEWMTFQALFQGIIQLSVAGRSIFIVAAGALALTGGLALACFVKAFASTFLARPRSAEAAHAKESAPSLLFGMGALSAICLLLGIVSGSLVFLLERVGNNLSAFQHTPSLFSSVSGSTLALSDGFASVSAPALFLLLAFGILLSWLVFTFAVNKKQKMSRGATWDCGTDLTERMEITATGFARSIVLIFEGVLRPSIQREVKYFDAKSRYLPKSVKVRSDIHNVYEQYFYRPLYRLIGATAARVKKIQSGNVNVYILYIFLAFIVLLFLL